MKRIRTILCLAGSLIILSTFGQKTVKKTSWEKFSLLFESIDQIGIVPEGKQATDTDDIHWMRLASISHEGCELRMEYITDKKENTSSVCSVSVLHIKPGDLTLLDIKGIPSLKLALSGKYILLPEESQNRTGKKATIFFRACYDKSTYEALKIAFEQQRKNCNQH